VRPVLRDHREHAGRGTRFAGSRLRRDPLRRCLPPVDKPRMRPVHADMLRSMGHLRLSTESLIDAGTDLRRVALELDSADTTADRVADAVGHPGLAAQVRDFAHGWDGRRTEMLEEVA